MGKLDILAKTTFEEETAKATNGALRWETAPETKLTSVFADGLLCIVDPDQTPHLVAPWNLARHEEIVVEIKMVGDKTDRIVFDRALLRRQGRQVERREQPNNPWTGQEALWIVAGSLPRWLKEDWTLEEVSPGCFKLSPANFDLFWISSNRLPLHDTLMPFLITRRGNRLIELLIWAVQRRPDAWLEHTIEVLPMNENQIKELGKYLVDTDDPDRLKRRAWFAEMMLDVVPEVREAIVAKSISKGLSEGLSKGLSKGRTEGRTEGLGPLLRIFERKLGRPLDANERETVFARLDEIGSEALGDVAFEMSGEALEAWLRSTDPH